MPILRMMRAAAVAAGTLGGLSGVAYGLLNEQSRRAERTIGTPAHAPLRADGTYLPDRTGPVDSTTTVSPLRFAVLGDSTAAGLGVAATSELPGVVLARELAEEAERPVTLTTYAAVGATSRDLDAQVSTALPDRPDVALVVIGANDVTTRLPVGGSARLLADGVARLRTAGIGTVVGTCPNLSTVLPIPQPLRSIAGYWSRRLARAQRAVERVGAYAVPLGDLLAPEFLSRPTELFSSDQFHPSATGYEAATAVLLPALCGAAGAWTAGPVPIRSGGPSAGRRRRPWTRLIRMLTGHSGSAEAPGWFRGRARLARRPRGYSNDRAVVRLTSGLRHRRSPPVRS